MKSMKRKKRFLLCFVSSFCLSACSFNSFSPYTDFPAIADDYIRIDGNHYYKPASYRMEYEEIYQDFPYESDRTINLPHVGDVKLLVVPVSFTNYTCSQTQLGCKDTLTQIQNAFFGKESKTMSESVSSYYAKSSFGKLRITGEVTSWYESTYRMEEIRSDPSYRRLSQLLLDATEWAKTQVHIADYDQNQDGFIDSVCFIYTAPYEESTNLWAFQSSLNTISNASSPNVKSYLWASVSFMNLRNAFSKPDARTYIHEMGHLFGLDDYYPTDNSNYFPLGKTDMMDLNIGDHNVFSKMLLNWTRPYVVDGDCEITITPSYLTGDCILVKTGWNETAMDEYLLLEFYTPKGLSARDSRLTFTYHQEKIHPLNKRGIKIYHVDARIGHFMTFSTQPFIGYDNEETQLKVEELHQQGQKTYRKIANRNTASLSPDQNFLITLLEPDGMTLQRVTATNSSLFQPGDMLSNYVFHDGSTLDYEITILKINAKEAHIAFRKTN